MKISSILSLGALIVPFAQSSQLSDDPPSYFEAVNNGAYLNWLVENSIESKYNNSVYIPSIDRVSGAAVHWSVDDEYVYLAVAARASGWVGFGLSEAGGMFGSDMALFSINRPGKIVDAHVVEVPFPSEDDCQHDWVYVNSSVPTLAVSVARTDGGSVQTNEASESEKSDEFIMFETRRKLVTDDPQDIGIIRDNLIAVPETRIIAAWGDTPDVSFHGTNVARGSIRFFKRDVVFPDFEDAMARNANGSFFVGSNNYVIPSNETTYVNFCVSRKDLIQRGVPNTTDTLSIIGFNPILNDGPSAPFIHHYVVTGIYNASDDACANGAGMDMVYVWAPGDSAFALPDFLGVNLFGEDGFQAFNVEIHYDNPRFERDVIDTSGVEIFFTTTARKVELGIFQMGDPFLTLFDEPVGNGLSSHHFECPGSCSGLFLSDGEPVTVIREYLHMHVSGTRMTNEQSRDGTVIRTASTEVWDFDQNGNVPVKQDQYEIRPGDSFTTGCYYRGDQDTRFGKGSREEMCMAFLYYYPRKTHKIVIPQGSFNFPMTCGFGIDWFENGACNADYIPGGILESEDDIHRVFGKQSAECFLETDEFPAVDTLTPAPAPVPAQEPTTAQADSPREPQPIPADDESMPSPINEGNLDSEDSVMSGAPAFMLGSLFGSLVALMIAIIYLV